MINHTEDCALARMLVVSGGFRAIVAAYVHSRAGRRVTLVERATSQADRMGVIGEISD